MSNIFAPVPVPWVPKKYQKTAVKFLLEHAAAALFLDPGLGKTSISLAAIKVLLKMKLTHKILLIAPLRVIQLVWPAELQKWEDFGKLRMVTLHGPHKNELLKEDADIYLINPEGLEWLLQVEKTKSAKKGRVSVKVDMKRWKKLGFDHLVIDELTRFKHGTTARFKALREVVPTFARRWGLTGSPAANGLMDLFGQCYILDEGRSLGPYITHYRQKYFLPSYDGFSWDLREGADIEIYERIKPLALRIGAEGNIDMPKLHPNPIYVDLPDDARRVYDELEDDLISQLDDRVVTAATAAVASMKCRQVANGGVFLAPELDGLIKKKLRKREWVDLHHEKANAVADLVEELQGSPLLVAYDFEHDLDRLRQVLGKDVPYLGGGVTGKRAKELEGLWNAGKLPVLLGHPQTVSLGLNLQQAGHHVCWHSLTWNYEDYDQFIRRVWRQGNDAKRVFVHHIIARDTIDEQIIGALHSKKRGQDALFVALQELRRVRRKL